MTRPITVLVMDHQAVVRSGLATILGAEPDIDIVGEAEDSSGAVNRALELKPDVILIDILMPGSSGLEVVISIRDQLPATKIIIFTVSDWQDDVVQGIRLGAHGYLLKTATATEMVDAVRRVVANDVVLSPHIASQLASYFRRNNHDSPSLSRREMEVLRLLAEGLTDAEIASRLFLSQRTVRTYLSRLLEKLNLRNRVEAAAYAGHQNLRNRPF